MKNKYKKILIFSILALFVISLITLLFFASPGEIVDKIGVRNGYILIFIVSFFGGFSTGGSISFISLLITLTAGGMNPVYLGIVSGISLAIGDTIMFYTGSKGRELIKGSWNKKINKLAGFIEKRKWFKKTIPLIAYAYIGFSPLPNDLLILFLATINYPIRKMGIIIILGDLTFALTVTLLTAFL